MKIIRRFIACRSGASAVEFAIVGSLFMLLSIGIVEFGRALHLRNQIAFAADVGVRKTLTTPSISTANLDTVIRAAFTHGDATKLQISIVTSGEGAARAREIKITYPLVPVLASIVPGPINLSIARRVPAA